MKSKLESSQTILKNIESVYDKLKGSKITEANKDKIIAKLKTDLAKISRFFHCSLEEAMFFSVVFGLKVVINSVYYNDIISYLDCNPFFVVGSENIFKSLQKKRLISKDDNYGRGSANINITREAYNAITSNKAFGSSPLQYENMYSLLQEIDSLIMERRRESISTSELFDEIHFMLQSEQSMAFVRNIKKQHISTRETTVLLYLCYHFANGDEYVDLNEMLNMIFDMMGEKVSTKRDLINKEAEIVKKGLVDFENDYFLMGRSIKLTDTAIEILFADEAEIFERKKIFKSANARLIEHKNLKEKKLFFNEPEKKQFNTLKNLLNEENLAQVMEKFAEANMPKGLVVLLYGEPGTGKTESVNELARKTCRNILMVDIANIKDKYVGESEKHIKQIFDNYKKAKEYFDLMPILLFNESDALISKRIEVSSSVDQMNNSMQNILLQELENFEGILFATSNLNVNLDKAFERRFLYKIQFNKPAKEIRQKIWKNKLPLIPEEELLKLARQYEFTGGQIDNVVRKFLLENILNSSNNDITLLHSLCNDEIFGINNWGKVGF